MKTNETMNMSELINFRKEVVNYINDNLVYIRENAETENISMPQASLDHYNRTVDAFCDDEEVLSEMQEIEFLSTAKELFNEGFAAHAGVLSEK